MAISIALWVGFHLLIFGMLALDLGVVHKVARAVGPREAAAWTAIWIAVSLLFCAGIALFRGTNAALQFLTAYVVEYALSVDNLFVFLMLFTYFRISPEYRHRLLFWGILGAFAIRAILIVVGTSLLRSFHWLLYLFGAFLVFTSLKMLAGKGTEIDVEKSALVRWTRKWLRVLPQAEGAHFFVRHRGRLQATPAFLALVVIEGSDVLFAMDSIPAVLGVTGDAFIAYTSNVFALLGLRSLFFLVAALIDRFRFLRFSLSAVLGFIGTKMLIDRWVQIPVPIALGVVALMLAAGVLASLVRPAKARPPPGAPGS